MPKRKFFITEVATCPACKGTGKQTDIQSISPHCAVCKGTGAVDVRVSLDDALEEYIVDVPNTGYFGIVIPKA